MIRDKKVVALIPARGGSKGIKKKNIYMVQGKPLIGYTIEAALACPYIDDVYVSTDSEEIQEISIKYGALAPFIRPKYLSGDTTKSIDVVMHFIDYLSASGKEYDILVFLQPTSPLRDGEDISNAIKQYVDLDSHGLVSISEVCVNPLLIRTIDENGLMTKMLEQNSTCRRQDMKKYYTVNGSIYINNIDELDLSTSLNDNKDYFIIEQGHGVDIDDMSDIALVEYYLKNRNGSI